MFYVRGVFFDGQRIPLPRSPEENRMGIRFLSFLINNAPQNG